MPSTAVMSSSARGNHPALLKGSLLAIDEEKMEIIPLLRREGADDIAPA